MVIDDLPMWGMVGESLMGDKGVTEKHIFTHRTVGISYNDDQIIEVNLTSENPVSIEEGMCNRCITGLWRTVTLYF